MLSDDAVEDGAYLARNSLFTLVFNLEFDPRVSGIAVFMNTKRHLN